MSSNRPAIAGRTEETNVGVWGIGSWSSAFAWGAGNPQRTPAAVDRFDGTGRWCRHCWGTDFWVRW